MCAGVKVCRCAQVCRSVQVCAGVQVHLIAAFRGKHTTTRVSERSSVMSFDLFMDGFVDINKSTDVSGLLTSDQI